MNTAYSMKLLSPQWQKKRLVIMQRDNFQCRFCGDGTQTLHVHHIIYLPNRDPWEYEDEYLVTTCQACHLDEEKLKAEDPMLIGLFSLTGLNRRQLYALSVELRRNLADDKARNRKFQELMDFLANT